MALTERLALLISANADEALVSFDRLGKKMAVLDAQGARTGRGFGTAVTGGAVLAGFALGEMVKDGVRALEIQQRVDQQTRAVLASTRSAAGVTAAQVGQLAQSISRYSEFSTDAVKASEVVLLSFTAVQDQVGAGNDIFARASAAVADLSARFGTDLTTTARQLGRALQDPVAGMSALTRSGIAFDAGTKKQIKSLAEQGRLLDAQKLLLDAVNTKTAGAAKTAGEGALGGWAQLRNSLQELDKTLAGPLLAPLTTGLHDVAHGLEVINEHPLAAKVTGDVLALVTLGVVASKAIGVLKKIRDSELASTLAGTAARTRSTLALDAEAAAAERAAAAMGALDLAEGAGGVGGKLAASRVALFGPVAAIVTAGVGVAIDEASQRNSLDKSLAAQVAAAKLETRKQQIARAAALGVFPGPKAGSYIIDPKADPDARAAGVAILALTNVGKAVVATTDKFANLKVATAAAKSSLADLLKLDVDARTQIATQAHNAAGFGDPTAALGALSGKISAARLAQRSADDAVLAAEHRITALQGSQSSAIRNAEAALARAKTTDQVAAAERRLADLRGAAGTANANHLTDAENSLARAKERSALANDRLNAAEGKAAAQHGLSAKQLLANEQLNAQDAQAKAAAAEKLVRAGVSRDVLNDLVSNVEQTAPGTLVRLAATITPAIAKGLNSARVSLVKSLTRLGGSPLDALEHGPTAKADALGRRWAKHVADAGYAQFISSPLYGLLYGPVLPPATPRGPSAPRTAPSATPGNLYGYAPKGGTNNYYLSGPIVASNPTQLRESLARDARLAQLGLG